MLRSNSETRSDYFNLQDLYQLLLTAYIHLSSLLTYVRTNTYLLVVVLVFIADKPSQIPSPSFRTLDCQPIEFHKMKMNQLERIQTN